MWVWVASFVWMLNEEEKKRKMPWLIVINVGLCSPFSYKWIRDNEGGIVVSSIMLNPFTLPLVWGQFAAWLTLTHTLASVDRV